MPPPFFLDRSLGRISVPRILREDGWNLQTLAEVFGIPRDERVTDVEWLRIAGSNGWPVLMKDGRIRYRSSEVGALVESDVRAFVLTSKNITANEMAEIYIKHKSQIYSEAYKHGPALFSVSATGIREIDLSG